MKLGGVCCSNVCMGGFSRTALHSLPYSYSKPPLIRIVVDKNQGHAFWAKK